MQRQRAFPRWLWISAGMERQKVAENVAFRAGNGEQKSLFALPLLLAFILEAFPKTRVSSLSFPSPSPLLSAPFYMKKTFRSGSLSLLSP